MSPQALLTIAFGGAFLTYILGKVSVKLRHFIAVSISLVLVAAVAYLYAKIGQEAAYFRFLGLELILRVDTLSWFFAIAIASLGALSIIFSLSYMKGRERTDFYYSMMLVVNAAMLGIVLSGDLVSFYVFWEIMSWSTFLLISYNRGRALAAGMKYIIMSVIGSVAMLVGILSLYVAYDSLAISEIATDLAAASSGYTLFLLVVFGIAFGIKNAVMPLHTWLPDSYAEAPSPFTAVLSGMLTRMGVYGLLLIIYVIVGAAGILGLGSSVLKFNHVLAWLGAVTIVIPTFVAMLQNDAKQLLAWHGIGQGGYMVLGIGFGIASQSTLGFAGGIFHTLNHAIYIVLLFMSVAAVQYRTGGERDLNSLGGLVRKMPIAFIGGLLGISGLIGVPLTNGFVSKWMIYKTLILEGYPFLAFAALIGTWGTILSVYKFLHNMFLGQLPEKYKDLEKSPFSMQLPIAVLSLTILLFGILPGIPLRVINAISTSFGFSSLNVTIWGLVSETGTLNTINLFFAVLVIGVIVWILFRRTARAVSVLQDDNYAAGAYVPQDRYHYTRGFYEPLFRMIKPYLRDVIDEFYYGLAAAVRRSSDTVRHLYTGDVGYYVTYIIIFLATLILAQIRWRPW
jgi:formate hydrogenlyase subunit 3/multisubunit Na+/H+ antiporter MnhD subunit